MIVVRSWLWLGTPLRSGTVPDTTTREREANGPPGDGPRVPAPSKLDQLWRDHASAVWGYAARRVGRADADDVVARTFLVACQTSRWTAIRHERAWLIGVARNMVLELRRKQARLSALAEHVAADLSTTRQMPGEDEADARIAAWMLIDALPEIDRELLLLVAWEDLSLADAARVLGIAPAAARMRMTRLRRNLGLRQRVARLGTTLEGRSDA